MWAWVMLAGCQEPVAAPEDVDGDGFRSPADCDDHDAAVSPDAQEVCDGIDNDCDGAVDDLDVVRYRDLDGDGHGNADISVSACTAPADYVSSGDDCNDSDPDVSPSAEEVCDGIDNDCDGIVDPEAVNTAWYRDEDGDGYGLGDPVYACEPPDDHGWLDGDCDDADVRVNPGYPEVCDGLDNDCDPATLEEGTVAWSDGAASEDLTAQFAKGIEGNPEEVVLREAGVVSVCGGTWYVSVNVLSDVDIIGLGATSADTVLSGGGVVTALSWPAKSVTASASRLTLTGGAGFYDNRYEQTVGGGVRCQSQSLVTLDDVVITGNTADMGGGLFVDQCDLYLSNAQVSDNTATYAGGGGIAAVSGNLTLDGVTISDNHATLSGGGVAMLGLDRSFFDVEDSRISDNSAQRGGGLVLMGWTISTLSSTEVTANTSTLHGGGILTQLIDQYGGSLTVDGCDLGETGTAADNAPDDLYSVDIAQAYAGYGAGTSLDCDYSGCE